MVKRMKNRSFGMCGLGLVESFIALLSPIIINEMKEEDLIIGSENR